MNRHSRRSLSSLLPPLSQPLSQPLVFVLAANLSLSGWSLIFLAVGYQSPLPQIVNHLSHRS